MLALTLAVRANGVNCSNRLPRERLTARCRPWPDDEVALKRMLDSSVVEMLSTCGSGFEPPNGMVKADGVHLRESTVVPTVTVTGMVVVSPAVWKTS